MTPNAQLLLDGNRGVYLPQQFATNYISDIPVQLREDFEILKYGPEHPDYWESWDDITLWLKPVINDKTYELYQDGDLWLIPEDEAHLIDEDNDIIIEHNRYNWTIIYRDTKAECVADRSLNNKTQTEAEELAQQFLPEGCTDFSIHKRETNEKEI